MLALRTTWAALVFFGLNAAVLYPALDHLGVRNVRDSFPLSTYPMFSRPRPDLETATYVVAFEPDGTRHAVPYTMWARGGWNQGRAQIHRYKNGKAGGFDALCDLLVDTLAKADSGWRAKVSEVHIVKGWYNRDRYFRDGHTLPEREQVYKSCTVPGRS